MRDQRDCPNEHIATLTPPGLRHCAHHLAIHIPTDITTTNRKAA